MKLFLFIFSLLGCGLLHAQKSILFVGTYNSPDTNGIYVVSFDEKTGQLTALSNLPISNPSYLAVSKNGKHIYAVLEDKKDKVAKTIGSLATLTFDAATNKLKLINKVSTNGSHPCYVAISNNGKNIVTANYSSGSLSIHKIDEKGIASHLIQEVVHKGKSIHARQGSPHIHGVFNVPESAGSFLATDLGTDEVVRYSFESDGKVKRINHESYKSAAGSGPRHLTFGKTANIVYVLNELNNTIDVLFDEKGFLRKVHSFNILPDTVTTTPTAADIHVSSDKKYLYCSIRGEVNAIAVYSLADATKPAWVQHIKTGGITPRNFVIHPSGKYLLVANQNSNNIVVFKRNIKTGILTATDKSITIGKPVCLKWLSSK